MLALLAPLAAYGIPLLRQRRVRLFPLLAPIGIVTVVAVVFYGSVRYRVPAEVSIAVLAAVSLERLVPPKALSYCRDSTSSRTSKEVRGGDVPCHGHAQSRSPL
jgi:hypothetical protein